MEGFSKHLLPLPNSIAEFCVEEIADFIRNFPMFDNE